MPGFHLALGSNVGDRERTLADAVARLKAAGLDIRSVSSLYETEPVGEAAGPGWFLNMAAAGATDLSPAELHAVCAGVEGAMGRERRLPGGPRTIDIDVLLYGDEVVATPALEIPHPRMHVRRFVLAPLAEIVPDVRHPVLGRTVAELLGAIDDPASVRRFEPESAVPSVRSGQGSRQ